MTLKANRKQRQFLRKAGRLGGKTTLMKDPEHFKRISRLGVEARKRKRQEEKDDPAAARD